MPNEIESLTMRVAKLECENRLLKRAGFGATLGVIILASNRSVKGSADY